MALKSGRMVSRSLGLQVTVAAAKFSDLVLRYSLLPLGNRVS